MPVARSAVSVWPGWHETAPLRATQISPVVGHSLMQCGPPTRTAAPPAVVMTVGTCSTLRTASVAASTSSSWLENWRESQRQPGLRGESEMLCSPETPRPLLASTGPTCHASCASSSMPSAPTGIRTSTLLDIWLTKTAPVTGS